MVRTSIAKPVIGFHHANVVNPGHPAFNTQAILQWTVQAMVASWIILIAFGALLLVLRYRQGGGYKRALGWIAIGGIVAEIGLGGIGGFLAIRANLEPTLVSTDSSPLALLISLISIGGALHSLAGQRNIHPLPAPNPL